MFTRPKQAFSAALILTLLHLLKISPFEIWFYYMISFSVFWPPYMQHLFSFENFSEDLTEYTANIGWKINIPFYRGYFKIFKATLA
jgi:hypothetical protein